MDLWLQLYIGGQQQWGIIIYSLVRVGGHYVDDKFKEPSAVVKYRKQMQSQAKGCNLPNESNVCISSPSYGDDGFVDWVVVLLLLLCTIMYVGCT